MSSHTILDRFNIKNPDVTPNIHGGLVQDFFHGAVVALAELLVELELVHVDRKGGAV